MQRLTLHCTDGAPTAEPNRRPATAPTASTPLLIDRPGLATLLCRSVPSLDRDDAAGRLPAALWIGGSKRWRYSDIAEWVEMGCPPRVEFEARRVRR
jgi:predicted DNA-binding transcriptional regulator AlpA